jgi:phage tail tape-measure protein
VNAWVEVEASIKTGTTVVLIDVEDYLRWQALGRPALSFGSHGYAQLWVDRKTVPLHRWVLGLVKGDGLFGDHRNRDRRDNRRGNLRAASPAESSQNVPARTRSGRRGVYQARSGRWYATIQVGGKSKYLGTFDTLEEAARVAEAERVRRMPFYVKEAL